MLKITEMSTTRVLVPDVTSPNLFTVDPVEILLDGRVHDSVQLPVPLERMKCDEILLEAHVGYSFIHRSTKLLKWAADLGFLKQKMLKEEVDINTFEGEKLFRRMVCRDEMVQYVYEYVVVEEFPR